MTEPTITQTVLFADLADRAVVATFDQPHASSDGGAILLKAADRQLGLLAALTATVPDARASTRVTHGVGDLLAQRVFAIACGHPDGNDADRLADDPIHKLLLGRDPIDGGRLASQPTISRFEHTAAPRMLLAMSAALADTVIARHRRRRRRVRLITIDLDVTEDQTHGAQQLTFFNGFYDHWCYLPLVGTLTFDDEARQYLVAAILRPGNAAGAAGAVSLLARLLPKLRRTFARARLRGRLDAGFATPAVFAYLEAAGVEYVVAMGGTRSSRATRSRRSCPCAPASPRHRTPRRPIRRRRIRRAAGQRPGARSSKPKWCGTTGGSHAITRALSSRICGRRPRGSTPTCIAPAAVVRTG